jgi:nitrate reductase gamma subunit
LSAGAIAGIAIGAVVALALVIGALLLCLRRRKQRQQVVNAAAYEQNPVQGRSIVLVRA